METNIDKLHPASSFYDLHATLNDGRELLFQSLKGKYVLVVNTASFCGYTGQYDALQQLHLQYGDKIAVIGFPSNNFGGQEPNSDEEIAGFCRINYGVTFPLTQKTSVKGSNIHPVYAWLSQAEQNGWNNKSPDWNFCKYLIDPQGHLLHFFNAGVNPLSENIISKLT